jgi:cytochrome P450
MEIVLGLAAIVNEFQLESLSQKEPEMSAWITLRPEKPLQVKVTRRS